ncbi:MAG: hypothetical protein AAF376_12095 [Pseudomonadota bacterium]
MTRILTISCLAATLAMASFGSAMAGGSSTPNPTAQTATGPATPAQPAPGGSTFVPRFLTVYTR